MRAWLMSLNGAITLSFIAYVTGLALLLLVATYDADFKNFIGERDQPGRVGLMMLLFMGIYGGWVWALLAAVGGSRVGLIVALILGLLIALGWSLQVILFFCPTPCPTGWPVGDIIVWSNLIFALLASAALGLQLRKLPN